MTRRTGQAVIYKDRLVWKVSYEFRFRTTPKGRDPSTTWGWRVLCKGNWWWSGDKDKKGHKIPGPSDRDDQGGEVKRTFLLNIDGTRLAEGAKPVFQNFRKYPSLPFSRWQFPTTLYGKARAI
jgi:hypothetical protein